MGGAARGGRGLARHDQTRAPQVETARPSHGEKRRLRRHTKRRLDRPGRISAALRQLTSDNQPQQERCSRLAALITAKFAEIKSTIELYRAGRAAEALEVVKTSRGQKVMEEFPGRSRDGAGGERAAGAAAQRT
jgi:hypothetical protein